MAKTVFILGAGASIGASPNAKTKFPRANEILKVVREVFCEEFGKSLPALYCYLNRYCPTKADVDRNHKLIPLWDSINLEELYGAIEFEKRLTSHHDCHDAYREFFSENYQREVTDILKKHYTDWTESSYSAPHNLKTFPYIHENFLRLVQGELLDVVSEVFGIFHGNEDTSNFKHLVHLFKEGDTVISFNYDLLLEHHLRHERPNDWFFNSGYRLGRATPKINFEFVGDTPIGDSKFRIIKLHGSCNWHWQIARKGNHRVSEQIGAGYDAPNDVAEALIATDNYRPIRHSDPKWKGYFERFIIPPTTYKAEYQFNAEFIHVVKHKISIGSSTMWIPQILYYKALKALRTADRLVFIGYSVAGIDASIRMLFRAAADMSGARQIIDVADPCTKVRDRIARIYPNADEFHHHESFSDYLASTEK